VYRKTLDMLDGPSVVVHLLPEWLLGPPQLERKGLSGAPTRALSKKFKSLGVGKFAV